MKTLAAMQAELRAILKSCYQLKGNPDSLHFIPVSGGADSTALAIVLHVLFPLVDWRLIFTDTGAEQKELYEGLDKLEMYLGKKITRIKQPLGLYEMIELPKEQGGYNGFLPGPSHRWCTRYLKLEPFENFMNDVRTGDETVFTYVGIRADEQQRIGLISHKDWIETEMPFQDLGIGREEVFRILDMTIGIPSFYKYRTRSGCSCCPFQRKSELVGLLQAQPIEFRRGAGYEKLSPADEGRHPENSPKVWKQTGLAMNHLTLPIPKFVDARTADQRSGPVKKAKVGRRRQDTVDLFDSEPMAGLWVGCEFFVDSWVGDHGVWWQSLVTFSTHKHALDMQLQSHYEHRIQTPETYGLSPEEMKQQLKLVAYYIEVPASLMDTSRPGKGSFTWTQGESYNRLRHLFDWAQRSLHAEGLRQSAEDYAGARIDSWQYEQWESTMAALQKLDGETGRVVRTEVFTPVDKIHEILDERLVSCAMCSI
jgi:hypothetical protein